MPRAFVVQENPNFDYSPVREYAEWPPKVVFHPGQVTLRPQSALRHARNVLGDMYPEDYLLLSGDPVMIGICMAVAADLIGTVRALRWDRRSFTYIPIEIDFDEPIETGELDGQESTEGSR